MGKRSLVPDPVEEYVGSVITQETPVQRKLRDETAKLPNAGMQIGADQGAFLQMLIRLTGTRRAIEVGTFTGYSSLSIASALPADGLVICCDVSEEWTSVAKRYWAEGGVASKVDLRIGPAVETLKKLIATKPEPFDFAFIDADKPGYDSYYEACLQLLRPGGLIAIDNVLWGGDVADPNENDANTLALRALNLKIRDDKRVDASILTIGDGVMLARKH